MIFTSADMRPGTKYSFLNQHSIQTRKTLKDHSQQIIYTMKWALPILFVWPCGQNKHSIFSNEPHMIRPCLVTCQTFIKIEYQNWNLNISLFFFACHLLRGSKLRWREDIGGELPSVRWTCVGWSLQPIGLLSADQAAKLILSLDVCQTFELMHFCWTLTLNHTL